MTSRPAHPGSRARRARPAESGTQRARRFVAMAKWMGALTSLIARNPRSSPAFGAELPEEAAVIGAHKFLDQPPIIIEPEDVDQVPYDPRARWGKRAGWRLGELARERALDPRLARHGAALGHDDPPGDLAVVEGRADRREVCSKPCVVGFEAVGTVKAKIFPVEVGINLGLVFT